MNIQKSFRYVFKNPLLLIVVIPAFLFHLLIVFPSGSYYCFGEQCGLFFWGAHGHDSIWHLAVIQNAFDTFPFALPIFSGTTLAGYNILLDIIVFGLTKLGIPAIIGFFKLLPIVWFLLFTDASIRFARKLCDKALFVALLLFFFFFAGSFGYLLTLYHTHSLNGSESLLAMQSGHTMLNIQYGFSLVILLYILILLTKSTISLKKTILLGILVFANFGMKFYAGVISFVIIGFFFLFQIRTIKKIKPIASSVFIVGACAAVAIIVFYNPFASLKNGPLLIFSPFAHVHSMIEEPSLFYLKDIVQARYFLQSKGVGPRLITIELFSLLLYLFFNLGTRFFGLLYWLFLLCQRKLRQLDVLIMMTIIAAIGLTTLFIQRGVWWNTVQFFYYAIVLSNIFSARFVYMLAIKNKLGIAAAVAIMTLTIPITIDFIREFSAFPAPAYLPKKEMDALDFLKKQPDGIVLTSAFNQSISYKWRKPQPLFAYADTAYVSAFSRKITYAADVNQLALLDVDYQKRLDETKVWSCNLIKKVDYVYELRDFEQEKNLVRCVHRLEVIFKNDEVIIYRRV